MLRFGNFYPLSHSGFILSHFVGAVCSGGASFTSFIFNVAHYSCLVKSISSTHLSPCWMTNRNTSLTVITSFRPVNALDVIELQSFVSCTHPSNCRRSVFLSFNHSAIDNWKCVFNTAVWLSLLALVNCTHWSLVNRADGFRETVANLGDPPRAYRSIPHSAIGKCKILHNLHFNTSWRTRAH